MDQGVFIITEGASVVGQEEFTIRRGTSSASDGFTLTATATYPPSQPTRTVTVRLETAPDSQALAAEIQERSGVRRAVVMAFRPRRITVRMVTPEGESVREHPLRPRTFLAPEAAFSVFALLPGLAGGDVWTIAPSGDPPVRSHLTDHGVDRIRVKGVERSLRHFSLELRNEPHHLWFDQQDRLIQVSVPARDLKAVRNHS